MASAALPTGHQAFFIATMLTPPPLSSTTPALGGFIQGPALWGPYAVGSPGPYLALCLPNRFHPGGVFFMRYLLRPIRCGVPLTLLTFKFSMSPYCRVLRYVPFIYCKFYAFYALSSNLLSVTILRLSAACVKSFFALFWGLGKNLQSLWKKGYSQETQ